MAKPLKLFVSYSRKDKEQLDELVKYLRPLVDAGKVAPWTDRLIEIGTAWDPAIKESLQSADIILLLVSSDFLDTDYISSIELVDARRRHEENAAVVIPILLSHCYHANYWFSEIQGLPEGFVPLSDAEAKGKNEKSRAYTHVVNKIAERADKLVKDRKLKPFELLVSNLIKDSKDGEFSIADKHTLSDEQARLGLTDVEVDEIKNRLLNQEREKKENHKRYIDTYAEYVEEYGLPLPASYIIQLKRRQEYLKITDQECNNLQPQIEAKVQEVLARKVQQAEQAAAAAKAKAETERQEQEDRPLEAQAEAAAAANELEAAAAAKAVAERREQEERARLARMQSEVPRGFALIQISADRGALVRVGNEWQQQTERITVSGYEQELAKGLAITMLQIPAGSFQMGSPASEAERRGNEGPQHRVELQSFFLGQTPVTQAQWKEVASWPQVDLKLNPNAARFKGPNRPVEQVSWEEAMEFCRRLSQRTKLVYTLPSEAQWEYACRASTTTPFAFGDTLTPDLANYDGNYTYGSGPKGQYRLQTTDVGSFAGNAWGLQDMHGNVWEWCLDPWHNSYTGAPADGSAWTVGGGTSRLLRGGSWVGVPRGCRSACRCDGLPDGRGLSVGFRVCCLPQD
ncbi:MAG: SUMF1/EgtB/PvdO family nonheme iron enzyme [Cyanobacteriota bacterium]